MNEEANINFYNVFIKFYKFCVTASSSECANINIFIWRRFDSMVRELHLAYLRWELRI